MELKRRLLVEWRKLDHLIVVAAASQWRRRLSACVGLTADTLSTFYVVFMVRCVKLMLRMFQFDCFLYHQNVTRLKRFTRYVHYAGEVEDIVKGRLAVV